MKCAILGHGTVGGGAAELLREQAEKIAAQAGQPLELKYILVRHDYPGSPFAPLMTTDFQRILSDPAVGVVAEVIGGVGAALDYTRRALSAGKSVVTSNKELVAEHGPELLALAEKKKVSYLFEGSVCGGIPLLAPLSQCLAANRVEELLGIVNGTTNYILTAMQTSGESFAQALKKAQELGYAEADPTADVEGLDAGRKTAILADIAFGQTVSPADVFTRGITEVTAADLALADKLGFCVKLLGRAMRAPDGVLAFVSPHLVPKTHMLAGVSGVMNACAVRTSAAGELVFCGPGAGRRPTGSAVVSDMVQAVRCGKKPCSPSLGKPGGKLAELSLLPSRWYVRTACGPEAIRAAAPEAEPVNALGEWGFLTKPADKNQLVAVLAAVGAQGAYRVLD